MKRIRNTIVLLEMDASMDDLDTSLEDDLEGMYNKYYSHVYFYLLSCAKSVSLAEDLAHDVILKAYSKRASFSGFGSAKGWLLTIARNCFIEYRRSENTHLKRIAEYQYFRTHQDGWSERKEEMMQEALLELEKLPPHFREPFELAVLNGMTYEAIAARLTLSIPSVRMRIHRAKTLLLQKLEPFQNRRDP